MIGRLPSTRPARVRLLTSVVAVVALTVYVVTGPLRDPAQFVRGNAIDFMAAYCGTVVAQSGADPYRVEPLRSCERRVIPARDPAAAWVVVPAPLPSYTFWLLGSLTRLPFEAAKVVWLLLGLAALVIASLCAARVTALPAAGVLLAFTPAIGLLNLFFGEPIPLAIALIGLAAVAAHERRDALAGVCAALALLEPHVGLGACVGAFVALPRARPAVVLTAAVLGAVGVLWLGWAHNVEYLQAVLPAQAWSEIAVNYQLSLTHLLIMAGVAARPALTLGSVSYVVTLMLGAFAGRAFARSGVRAAAVYLPVTFTMLGGAYIHTPEIAAALPGALLVCTRTSGLPRLVATAALALLIVPWNAGFSIVAVPLVLVAVGAASALVRADGCAPLRVAAGIALSLAAYIWLMPLPHHVAHPVLALPGAIRPDDLASTDWAMYVASMGWMLDEDVRRAMLKAPQWIGLLLTIVSTGVALTPWRSHRELRPGS